MNNCSRLRPYLTIVLRAADRMNLERAEEVLRHADRKCLLPTAAEQQLEALAEAVPALAHAAFRGVLQNHQRQFRILHALEELRGSLAPLPLRRVVARVADAPVLAWNNSVKCTIEWVGSNASYPTAQLHAVGALAPDDFHLLPRPSHQIFRA